MNNLDRMYKSIDIIELNLKTQMTVQEISAEMGFSYYYFSRLFKATFGIGLKEYFRGRRLTESVSDLLESKSSILDIALDYGFTSSEGFSRAFKGMFGLNPSKVSRENFPVNLRMGKLSKTIIDSRKFLENMEPEVVKMNEIILVGIPFYHDLTMKNDLSSQWQTLLDQVDRLVNLKEPHRFYQMQFWHSDIDDGAVYFFVGVEMKSVIEVPIHLSVKVIPEQRYLKFLHKGLANTVGHTYRYAYEEWILKGDYLLPHFYNFEFYGEENLGPYNEESITEIYIPIV